MKEIVVLEWTFTPVDYFEEVIRIVRDNYEMTIENGKVDARIEAQYYDSESDLRMKLHESLNSRFLGAQIFNQKQFELSKPSMSRIHLDGRRTIYIHPEPIKIKVTTGTPDIIITDSSGNVIRDSRKERIERRKALAELVEKHRAHSPILQSLLDSLTCSLRKHDNELVYLYEIREALAKELGGEEIARQLLSITRNSWRRFGRLANDEPLKQGRHRGKNVGILRDATEDELIEARTFAREIIEKYLYYLDNTQQHNK